MYTHRKDIVKWKHELAKYDLEKIHLSPNQLTILKRLQKYSKNYKSIEKSHA
jgi:hypothetical protein